jgi:ATP-dependent RNA helicase DHX8/PRP22
MFSSYFDNCPYLVMVGKCYPVKLLWNSTLSNFRVEDSVQAAMKIHLNEGLGDILVFLTGSDDCELAVKHTYQTLERL